MTNEKAGTAAVGWFVCISFFLLACFFYIFFVGTALKDYREAVRKLNEIEAAFVEKDVKNRALNGELLSLERARNRLQEIKEQHYGQWREERFLVELSSAAVENDVQVRKLKFFEAADLGYALVVPVELELRGGYISLVAFIRQLENLANVTKIKKLNLKAEGQKRYVSQAADSTGEPGTTVAGAVYKAPFATSPEAIAATVTLHVFFCPMQTDETGKQKDTKVLEGKRTDPFTSVKNQ